MYSHSPIGGQTGPKFHHTSLSLVYIAALCRVDDRINQGSQVQKSG
jgi:hypothetical protein